MRASHVADRIFRFIGWFFLVFGGVFMAVGAGVLLAFQHAAVESSDAFIVAPIFIGIGGIFFALGLFFLLRVRRARKRIERLLQDGVSYPAQAVHAYYNESMRVNGRPPLVLECQYTDRYGATHLVRSGNLWNQLRAEPEAYEITVWVDAHDDKNYYVEVLNTPSVFGGSIDHDDR